MARTRSISDLSVWRQRAADTYRAHLVFAIRQFELSPKDKHAAEKLLKLIPKEDQEQHVLEEFGGFLCVGQPMADVKTLSALLDRFAHDLSKAVLLVPKKLDVYVAYAAEAVQDPHCDYAIQMERVCRSNHADFSKAVEALGAGAPENGYFATASSDWFRKHILDPEKCRALAIPEAN